MKRLSQGWQPGRRGPRLSGPLQRLRGSRPRARRPRGGHPRVRRPSPHAGRARPDRAGTPFGLAGSSNVRKSLARSFAVAGCPAFPAPGFGMPGPSPAVLVRCSECLRRCCPFPAPGSPRLALGFPLPVPHERSCRGRRQSPSPKGRDAPRVRQRLPARWFLQVGDRRGYLGLAGARFRAEQRIVPRPASALLPTPRAVPSLRDTPGGASVPRARRGP